MIYWILVIWAIGMIIAWFLVRKESNDFMVKFAEVIMWPLTLVLYGIYLLHKKL